MIWQWILAACFAVLIFFAPKLVQLNWTRKFYANYYRSVFSEEAERAVEAGVPPRVSRALWTVEEALYQRPIISLFAIRRFVKNKSTDANEDQKDAQDEPTNEQATHMMLALEYAKRAILFSIPLVGSIAAIVQRMKFAAMKGIPKPSIEDFIATLNLHRN